MSEVIVKAEERKEFGKNPSRRLRVEGKIPGVVYGRGLECVSVVVDSADVFQILSSDSGRNTIFELETDSGRKDVLIKDLQVDPVKESLLHVDFLCIAKDQVMEFQIPVETIGEAEGVKTHGGILEVVLREISVECLPGDVPDQIRVDITNVDVGGAIRVSELEIISSKIKVLSDPEFVVLTVLPPRVEEEPEVVVEEEEALEPEVIKKGKGEEGQAEGAAASEVPRETEE
ncbi:MAG TPA: 50S ribosomal protein L25 [Acidobacteriota bacterium]|nr:50S ribosomal protein L25 [Acidobacteriota bacterium]